MGGHYATVSRMIKKCEEDVLHGKTPETLVREVLKPSKTSGSRLVGGDKGMGESLRSDLVGRRLRLIVNRASVTYHQDQNEYFFVLNLADQPIGANAILPAACQLFSQRCAISAGIIVGADPLPQVAHDFSLDLTIKLG